MTINDYINWKEQKKANKNLSEICLKQKHKDISREVSEMLKDQK